MSPLLAAVHGAIASGDSAQIAAAFKTIIEADGIVSESANHVAALIENHRLPYIDFLIHYVQSNPDLITSAQVRVAEAFAEQGRVDDAAIEARVFLRKLLSWDKFKDSSAGDGFKNLASRAYLVITAAYTTAGARAYSLRLLERGLAIAASQNSKNFLIKEIANIHKELETPGNALLNQKWEEFFASGAHAAPLIKHCTQLHLLTLAKRVELLESEFRFTAGFQLPSDEFLLEVFTIRAKDQSGPDMYILK